MHNVPTSPVWARAWAGAGLLLALGALTASAVPVRESQQFTSQPGEVDAPFAPRPASGKSLQDTVWIADWTFDAPGGGCTSAGWTNAVDRARTR